MNTTSADPSSVSSQSPTAGGGSSLIRGSALNHLRVSGKGLEERCASLHEWVEAHRRQALVHFWRVATRTTGERIVVGDENGQNPRDCVNFSSQDYLGLAQSPRVKEAAKRAIDELGIHSAGSPALVGRTSALLNLEQRLACVVGKEACQIYPTGWAAGFGVITGLVRRRDELLIDELAHSCLHEGARHATPRVTRFAHNDLNQLERLLRERRERSDDGGIFVVAESLYSMDGDGPDLAALLRLVRKYEAILILDVAHDFGALGATGRGLLDSIDRIDGPDVIMGSFSKVFASNGGFVASSAKVKEYLGAYSAPWMFSNALSPIQARIVLECLAIVFSDEGARLRQELMANILCLRERMQAAGFEIGGSPSPIVPVFVGDEHLARITFRNIQAGGLSANLVVFPAVPEGRARFRFQLMSTHTHEAITEAAEIMADARRAAAEELGMR
jgi:7-keto-8-aminopelargonate synthetase-like enzyme